jgi:membrane associated rhomboid family serine protease
MDWTSYILPALIAIFGFVEYRRRERVHALRLADLRRGVAPSFERPRPTLFSVISSGIAALLLLLLAISVFLMALATGKVFGSISAVWGFFGLLFLCVMALFVTTLLRYRRKG